MGEKKIKLTDEDVIEKIELCKIVHDNKYTYDKVVYVNYGTKITITCPYHGDFKKILYEHTKGSGCKLCSKGDKNLKLRKSREDFINTSNLVHDGKYNYDKVPKSFNVKHKVTIICPIHEDFSQTADSHKRGVGCPYCVGKSNNNVEKSILIRTQKINEIIKKNKFESVKLIELPINDKDKYKFNCEIHGDLLKNKSQVYKGQICGECLKLKNKKTQFLRELKKMNKIHNNKFEYLDYNELVNRKKRITIKCPEHNHIFKIYKAFHIQSKHGGCVHCTKQYKNYGIKEQDVLINQFKSVHGDLYNYNNVFYERSEIKVWITCKKHGDFPQTPASHLNGSGCPKCKHSSGEKLIQNLLKKMNIHHETQKCFYGCFNDKTGKHLTFDIYVPEFHTCIEFDGHQHFISVENWGGEESLKEVQYRDNIKNNYCENNDINLIRIPYTLTKLEIVDILNKEFNKNLVIEIKKLTKWIDINIRDRVKDYKTREEFRKSDGALWYYCYKNKLLDVICEHMAPKIRHSHETVKIICDQYDDYTLFEKEQKGIISYIRKNKYYDLTEHMEKKKIYRSDELIIEELKKYEYKMDVRKNNGALYAVALNRGLINILKDKTIWWTEQMVRDAFKKCRTKTELTKLYRGAENYAKKHGLYDELSCHLVKKHPRVSRAPRTLNQG
jgi:hypothetical protein